MRPVDMQPGKLVRRAAILLIAAIAILNSLPASALPAHYTGESPEKIPGWSTMPDNLKKILILFTPKTVNAMAPTLVEKNNLTLHHAIMYRPSSFDKTVIRDVATVKPTIYPITKIKVEYLTPAETPKYATPEWPYHRFLIDFPLTYPGMDPNWEVDLISACIQYVPRDLVDEEKFQQLKKYMIESNCSRETVTITVIDGITVYQMFKTIRIIEGYNKIKNEYVGKNFRDVAFVGQTCFSYDRYIVTIYADCEREMGYNESFFEPSSEKDIAPTIAKMKWETSNNRDIVPLTKAVAQLVKSITPPPPPPPPPAPLNPKLTVDISQVIDNPDILVSKKPALIAMKLTWDNQECEQVATTIKWYRNGKLGNLTDVVFKRTYLQSEINRAKDYVIFTFLPDVAAGTVEKHEVELTLKNVKDANGKPMVLKKQVSIPVDTMKNRVINIIFIPVNIGTWDPKYKYTEGFDRLDKTVFGNFRETQMAYMRGIYPLAPANIIDKTEKNIFMDVPPDYVGQKKSDSLILKLLEGLEIYYQEYNKGKKGLAPGTTGPGVDYVVGIVGREWLGDMGITEPRYPHAVLMEINAPGTIAAHEIGHLLGLFHNQKTYGKAVFSDCGYWVKSLNPPVYDRIVPVYNNVPTFDFMDEDPKTEANAWICRDNYRLLVKLLKGQ